MTQQNAHQNPLMIVSRIVLKWQATEVRTILILVGPESQGCLTCIGELGEA